MTQDDAISGLMIALDAGDLARASELIASGDAAALLCAAADASEQRLMADLARAVRSTQDLVTLADRHGTAASRARTRRAYAQALTYSNRFEEALGVLAEALPLAEEDRVEVGRIRLTMLHAHARQARFAEAVECGELARDAFLAAGERLHVGRAENNLGILERMRDRPAAALEHFTSAARALADQPALLAHVENNRAEALLDLDRFAEAEDAFYASLREFRATGAQRHAGIVLGNLADLTSRQGRLHESLSLFEKARRAMGDASAPGDAARLAVEHADVLRTLGMLRPADRAYAEAVGTLTGLGMFAEAARGHLGRGRVLANLGDAEATASFEHAENLFTEQKNATGRARALTARAELTSRNDRHDESHRLLEEARLAAGERPALRAWIDLVASGAFMRAGRHTEAATIAARAAEIAESLRIAPLAADLRHVRGAALLAGGDPRMAADELRLAVRHAERTRGMLSSDRFRTSFLGDRARIWEDCATAILDADGPGNAAEAFLMIEMSKARGLLDLLTDRDGTGPRSGSAEVLAELKRVTGELGALYDRAHDDPGTSPDQRARREREIRDREERRERLLIRASSDAGVAGSFARPDRLEEIQSTIPQDGAVIEYFAEGDWLSAAVVRGDGLEFVRKLALLSSVRDMTDRLMFQVGRALARGLAPGPKAEAIKLEIDEAMTSLGHMVLGPLDGSLQGVLRAAAVPTAPLHRVPLAALASSRCGGSTPIEIAVVPSASVLRRLQRPATGPALIIGVSDERAPSADAEAHAIAKHLPDATILTGDLATKQAFIERASGRGHIHFAGHARFIGTNPEASGLKLADGWLTAAEIASLDLGGASIMLSGCDTGRVAVEGGDEQMGLARAVLTAGASAVTMTLWPVHDRSTAEIMAMAYSRMYGQGAGHTSPIGRAIAAVQREMKDSGAHAAVWAPFITVCCPW